MSMIPSPVLIIGDPVLSQRTVFLSKKKYNDFSWITIDANENTIDDIRSISGMNTFEDSKRFILIKNLQNKKDFREFIAELVQSSSDDLKFVIWDSSSEIKSDPKTGINKTWQDWINLLKKNEKFVLVNSGFDFPDNDYKDSVSYVESLFQKNNKKIDPVASKIFIDIVGRNRAMIVSEVNKLSIISPQNIDRNFVIDNCYPSSKSAVLYQFGNDLDSGDLSKSIISLEKFLSSGIDANILAQIIVNKSRWHLAICSFYKEGLDFYTIKSKILGMGKFPSCVWHNDQLTDSQKNKLASNLNEDENMISFMSLKMGIPLNYINVEKKSNIKTVRKGEVIPMPFMADMMMSYFQDKIVNTNKKNYSDQDLRNNILNRAINLYLLCTECLKDVRYNEISQKESLYEMVKAWTNTTV